MYTITPSHIIEYLYCPRFTYFEYVLAIPQYEEKHYKAMKGRDMHELKLVQNKEYLRKRIGVKEKFADQYLTNTFLRGRVDEVLRLNDDTYAPLDYKFAVYDDRVYNTYRTQLICYSILIEDNFNAVVNRGFLVYIRSKNKLVEIEVHDADKEHVKQCAEEIHTIIEKNYYPKATKHKQRCLSCTYNNICIK
jgi:CRISPR-associated exonuclease Cas4